MIKIKNLNKHFGNIHAVNDLSLRVKTGELFAFLGVNGAGKSTTISMICGNEKKDSGELFVAGYNVDTDLDQIKRRIGVVFQNSVLDTSLSVYDNLQCRAALHGITGKAFEERLKEISGLLELEDFLKRPFGKLSGGQRRRVDISRAIFHKPALLILDEPTTGLDPMNRRLMWNVINRLRKDENMTVLLTTHYMEEAIDADYVVIIDEGKVLAEGTPLELKNSYTGDFLTIYGVEEEAIKALGKTYTKVRDAYRIPIKSTSEILPLISKHKELFNDFEVTKGGMDDVFLNITGKDLSEVSK